MADETLNIRITADTKNAEGALGGLRGALGGIGDILKTGVGVALGGFINEGIGALVGGLKDSITSAMDAEKNQAQLAAVLKSTGGAAGVSADMANELASSLQKVTTFEDDTVLSGENLLLTFTNIGKNVFPDATKTMLDMSQALGQDVKSSAIQLGKALNDPLQGLTALSRVGVSFTDQQKEQIKTLQESGDMMGAQTVILDELKREFGGAAEAAGSTFGGKLEILNNQFNDIKEAIGGAIIPILSDAAGALIAFVGNPQVQAGVATLVSGFQDLWHSLTGVIGSLHIDWSGLLGGIQDFVSQLLQMNPGQILAQMFLPSAIMNAMGMDTSGFADLFNNIISGLQGAAQGLIDWVSGSLGPALASSFAQISAAAGPALQMLGDWINTTILPALQQLGQWLGPLLAQGFAMLGEFIVKTALPALTQLGVWIVGTGLPAVGQFAMWVGGVLNDAFRSAGQLWTILVIGFQKAGTFIEGAKQGLMDLAAALIGPVADAFMWFQSNVLDPIKEALAALRMWISLTIDALTKLGAMAAGAGAANPFGGQRADGGVVNAGMTYLVGERGPELFTPRTSGMITPNAALAGAGGGAVVINYQPFISTADRAEAQERLTPLVLEILRSVK